MLHGLLAGGIQDFISVGITGPDSTWGGDLAIRFIRHIMAMWTHGMIRFGTALFIPIPISILILIIRASMIHGDIEDGAEATDGIHGFTEVMGMATRMLLVSGMAIIPDRIELSELPTEVWFQIGRWCVVPDTQEEERSPEYQDHHQMV
jgi:hypothetical protein